MKKYSLLVLFILLFFSDIIYLYLMTYLTIEIFYNIDDTESPFFFFLSLAILFIKVSYFIESKIELKKNNNYIYVAIFTIFIYFISLMSINFYGTVHVFDIINYLFFIPFIFVFILGKVYYYKKGYVDPKI